MEPLQPPPQQRGMVLMWNAAAAAAATRLPPIGARQPQARCTHTRCCEPRHAAHHDVSGAATFCRSGAGRGAAALGTGHVAQPNPSRPRKPRPTTVCARWRHHTHIVHHHHTGVRAACTGGTPRPWPPPTCLQALPALDSSRGPPARTASTACSTLPPPRSPSAPAQAQVDGAGECAAENIVVLHAHNRALFIGSMKRQRQQRNNMVPAYFYTG